MSAPAAPSPSGPETVPTADAPSVATVDTVDTVDTASGNGAEQTAAQRMFSTAILISAVRCVLAYVVLPFVAPAVGFASGAGPVLGILIGLTAITANGFTIRRFHRADHRYRWHYTVVAGAVISLLLVLMVRDLTQLL